MHVRMPMVGWIIDCKASIYPGSEIPASKMPSVVVCSKRHTDRGTPSWEFHERGERVTVSSSAVSW